MVHSILLIAARMRIDKRFFGRGLLGEAGNPERFESVERSQTASCRRAHWERKSYRGVNERSRRQDERCTRLLASTHITRSSGTTSRI